VSEQLIFDLRSIIVEGIVLAINDAGIVQTVDVQTHDGVVRSGIEVWQPAGFSGTPEETGRVLLFAVGGDAANLRALPVVDDQRYGGQEPGARTMYCRDGTRVSVRPGGLVEVWGGTSITTNSPTCVINAPNGATINGPLIVNGSITATGDITDSSGTNTATVAALRSAHDLHKHTATGGLTSTPNITV